MTAPRGGRPEPGSFDAITLDVGGVFVVPHHDRLAAAFAAADVPVDRDRFWDGHYLAMHAVDEARSPAETFGTYVPAFCHAIGLRDAAFAAGVAALEPIFGPSGLWTEPMPESIAAVRALADTGIPLAIVSNADGSVDQILRNAGVCQTGPGEFVAMTVIVDSGALGVAKPDPAIFTPALAALGSEAARTLHVGDSVHYDVVGAEAAGLMAAHFDPRRLCHDASHLHLESLTELI